MSSTYDHAQIVVIRSIAVQLLHGWGRVPSGYETAACLKRAQQLYDESLKVGIPEIEEAPPVVEV